MSLTIELEQETDGRWIAEVPDIPGVMAYGDTRDEAIERVQALSLRVLAGSIGPRRACVAAVSGKDS